MSWFWRKFDGALAAAFPGWAASRAISRFALAEAERLSAFREARTTRLDRPVTNRGTSADYDLELGYSRRQIVERARSLDNTNLLAGALLDTSGDFVVGDGFRLRATSGDPAWNKENQRLWEEWTENEADVRGLDSWDDLIELVYRSWLRDGDVAILLNADGTIRVIESDEIASPEGGYYRPSMADGVELDRKGRPAAYWVFDPDPNVLYSDRRAAMHRLVRIEAKHVLFLARRMRANQTRGISVFNGMINLLEQLDGTIEAVTVAHRMAALFALVIKKKAAFSGKLTRTDSNGTERPQLDFEPGSIMRLEPDEDVEQIKPEHPTAQASQHLRDLGRLASTRFATPFEFVVRDLSIGNYSNYRTGLVLVKKSRIKKQKRLTRLSSTLRNWKTIQWMEEKRLRTRSDALSHHWIRPGIPWLDPVADLQTGLAAVDAGIETLTGLAGDRGYDLEDVLELRQREIQEFMKREIPLVRSTLTRDPTLPPQDEEEQDPQDEPAP